MTGPVVLDPLILTLLSTGVPLTDLDRRIIAERHGEPPREGRAAPRCPYCGHAYRVGARRCPSEIWLHTGSARAAVEAMPPATATRRCRQCVGPVVVQLGTRGAPLCDSCQDQPDLFEDDASPPGLTRQTTL